MAKLHLHPVGLVLIFFGCVLCTTNDWTCRLCNGCILESWWFHVNNRFLAWVVALGGIAATTNFCLKTPVRNESAGSYCSRTYQLEWVRRKILHEDVCICPALVCCSQQSFDGVWHPSKHRSGRSGLSSSCSLSCSWHASLMHSVSLWPWLYHWDVSYLWWHIDHSGRVPGQDDALSDKECSMWAKTSPALRANTCPPPSPFREGPLHLPDVLGSCYKPPDHH